MDAADLDGLRRAPDLLRAPHRTLMTWHGATWLERSERATEEDTATLLTQLQLRLGLTVIDLGCGTGFHARRIQQAVGATGTVYCVDLQPEMLAKADALAKAEGLTLSLVAGEHDRVPLPDGVADRVLLVDVWHEIQQPEAMLAELKRVLAPGGQVAIVEFRLDGASAAHIKPEHRMTAAQVRSEFEAAGWTLASRFEDLPSQHLLRFERAP